MSENAVDPDEREQCSSRDDNSTRQERQQQQERHTGKTDARGKRGKERPRMSCRRRGSSSDDREAGAGAPLDTRCRNRQERATLAHALLLGCANANLPSLPLLQPGCREDWKRAPDERQSVASARTRALTLEPRTDSLAQFTIRSSADFLSSSLSASLLLLTSLAQSVTCSRSSFHTRVSASKAAD